MGNFRKLKIGKNKLIEILLFSLQKKDLVLSILKKKRVLIKELKISSKKRILKMYKLAIWINCKVFMNSQEQKKGLFITLIIKISKI